MQQLAPATRQGKVVARRGARNRMAGATSLLFVAPAVLLNFLFFIVPLVLAAWISLHRWPVLGEHVFIGLKNYANLLHDEVFWGSLLFSTKYMLLVTPAIFIPATVLALLVNERIRGVTLFRTIYFAPYVIAFATTSLMWKWMYNEIFGLINYLLLSVGLIDRSVIWLGSPKLALFSIIVSVVWKTAGLNMILLLAGLQAIPTELYEAAAIDGAGSWYRFTRITLPLLRPTFATALVISVIGSYLAFDQFFLMTAGGPGRDTTSVVMWIYRTSFQFFEQGSGSAMSFVLLGILVALSYVQLRVVRRVTEY